MKTCSLLCFILLLPALFADDWPQWRGPERDGVWRETGLVDSFKKDRLPAAWTVKIGGGYAGPSVQGDQVVVFDRLREPDRERVLCVDRKDGSKRWEKIYDCPYNKVKYPAGPRAAVTIDGDRAFALGSTGRLHALAMKDGMVLWHRDLEDELDIQMPIWGISGAPLVDGDRLYLQIGGKGACMVCLDKRTGKTIWTALDDPASYSSPVLVERGGEKTLVVWTGTRMVGLDPADGKQRWAEELGFTRWVIGISTPVFEQDQFFVTATDKGSMMLRWNGPSSAKLDWKQGGKGEADTIALHSLMCTPDFVGGHVYGISKGGVLRCLDAKNGERIWSDERATSQTRFSSLHLVRNGDRHWLFNDQGELIIAKLSPAGYTEIDRAKIIDPTRDQNRADRRGVTWSHPAFAHRHVFARSDAELVCVDLGKK